MTTALAPRVLHVLDHSLPLHSGYTFRSQAILRAQKSFGWDPIAVTSPKHLVSWHGPWENEETIEGIRYYRTAAVSSNNSPLAEITLMRQLARRIEEVAVREKPDLLHAHSPILNVLPAIKVGRRLRIPVVYEIRAFWEDAAADHRTYSEGSLKYRTVRFLESRSCKRSRHVFVLCEGIKRDLMARGIDSGKLTIISNGIDPERFTVAAPDKACLEAWNLRGMRTIGYIGSFYRYEGLDLLVSAFAEISRRRDDTRLVLVGTGEMEPMLRSQIEKLGMNGKVVLAGRIEGDRIPGIYALIDILVYPRYSMRLTELVTPLKPLEAMAMRKVLIASNIGGHRELIRHAENGLLFPPGNQSALVESIEFLLNSPQVCEKLASQGFDWVRRTKSWETTTSPYAAIYSQILGADSPTHERGTIG